MNYFVCIDGITIASNLSQQQVINKARTKHTKHPELGGLQIGIGKIKYKDGKRMYTMLPYFYYLN